MFIRYVALRLVSLDFERKLVVDFRSRGRWIFFQAFFVTETPRFSAGNGRSPLIVEGCRNHILSETCFRYKI